METDINVTALPYSQPTQSGGVAADTPPKRPKPKKVRRNGLTYEQWYKTVPKDRNNTKHYNLERAFELAPWEELEAWRTSSLKDLKAGKNHLRSAYLNPKTGVYEFAKRKDHPTINMELEFYNRDKNFRKQYELDKSGDYYRYVPRKSKNNRSSRRSKSIFAIARAATNDFPVDYADDIV